MMTFLKKKQEKEKETKKCVCVFIFIVQLGDDCLNREGNLGFSVLPSRLAKVTRLPSICPQ